jgi:hypothetical protein
VVGQIAPKSLDEAFPHPTEILWFIARGLTERLAQLGDSQQWEGMRNLERLSPTSGCGFDLREDQDLRALRFLYPVKDAASDCP